MATTFPTTLDQLLNPTGTDSVQLVSHAAQHSNANDAIEALEAKLGVNNSTDATTIDYKVRDLISKIYTNEMAQDTIAAALAAGTHGNITVAYDDAANSLSLTATYGDEQVMDAIATSLTAGGGITKVYNDAANTITVSVDTTVIATKQYVDDSVSALSNTATNTFVPQSDVGQLDGVASLDAAGFVPQSQLDINERIQDQAAKLITDGTHTRISVSYNDTANTLNLTATYADEEVMDAIAQSLTAGYGITKDYNDAGNTITLSVNTSYIATQQYVTDSINALIDSAPNVLNTLKEIAIALNNDPSFAATMTTALAGKASNEALIQGLLTKSDVGHAHNSTDLLDFTEGVQDVVGGMVSGNTESSGLSVTYDDPTGKLNFEITTANLPQFTENVQDSAATLFTHANHSNVTATYDDANNQIIFTAFPQLTQEQVQDFLAPLFTHGNNPNITATYDDTANKMILEAIIPASHAVMSAGAPSNPIDGQFWFDTDEYRSGNTRALKVWNALTTTWEYIATDLSLSSTNTWTSKNTFNNGIIIGLSSPPSTPTLGQIYYNTNLAKLKVWDGLLWQDISGSGGGGGGLSLIASDTTVPPSTFFIGLIAPPNGSTVSGDLWIDVDDDAGSTEFIFAGPNPPAEGTYGLDTIWIDTDEPDLPLIYSDNEPPSYSAVDGDFWVDLDDTSGQSILSSTTAPSPTQTEFWLDLTTEEGVLSYSDLFKYNAAQITNYASLPAASNYSGMIAYVSSESSLYVAANNQWVKIFPNYDAEALLWSGI
jgi:hypothetical protein